MVIDYGKPDLVAVGTNSDVDTSEEDVVVVTDLAKMENSQFSVFIKAVLGTNTSLTIRYYYRYVIGGDWYVVPQRATSDGAISQAIDVLTTVLLYVRDFPISGAVAFKVTAQGTGGADSTVEAAIMQRNN